MFERQFTTYSLFLKFLSLMKYSSDHNKRKSVVAKCGEYEECGGTSHPNDIILGDFIVCILTLSYWRITPFLFIKARHFVM